MSKQNPEYAHLSDRDNTPHKLDTSFLAFESIEKIHSEGHLIVCSPCDLGVTLNGGRRGSKHGPECLIHQYSKMQNHSGLKTQVVTLKTKNAYRDLSSNQDLYKTQLKEILSKKSTLVHLGGGHDHVYPLLSELTACLDQNKDSKLYVLNIDAHLDTRQDKAVHSGTPFRQWINELSSANKNRSQFLQVGIEKEYNTATNYQFSDEFMQVLHHDDFAKETNSFVQLGSTTEKWLSQINDNDRLLLSLDCDGIDSLEMSAVSAPNPHGTSVTWMAALIDHVKSLKLSQVCFGLYEYNPLFDDLGCSQGRKLAFLFNQFLK